MYSNLARCYALKEFCLARYKPPTHPINSLNWCIEYFALMFRAVYSPLYVWVSSCTCEVIKIFLLIFGLSILNIILMKSEIFLFNSLELFWKRLITQNRGSHDFTSI